MFVQLEFSERQKKNKQIVQQFKIVLTHEDAMSYCAIEFTRGVETERNEFGNFPLMKKNISVFNNALLTFDDSGMFVVLIDK